MSAADVTSTAAASTALTLTSVDVDGGRSLYCTSDGAALCRDVDLAAWAGLTRPRDIRRTILTAIEDGAITSGAVGARATDVPAYVAVEETTVRGSRGGTQIATTYYLTESGALMIASRLRTERAVRLTREVMSTYSAMRRGAMPAVVAPVAAAPAMPASIDPAMLTALVNAAVAPFASALDRALATMERIVTSQAAAMPAPQPPPALPAPAPPVAPTPHPAAHVEPRALPMTDSWLSATRIAARASYALQRNVTPQAIGLALTSLGLRERRECYRVELVERAHGAEGEAASFRWSPEAQKIVIDYLRAARAAQPRTRTRSTASTSETAGPGLASARAGARQVLAAITNKTAA